MLFQAWELRSGLPGGAPPSPVVVRRETGGRWTDVSPIATHPASLDPYLFVDSDTGRIFTLDWIANGVPYCSAISYSDDAGDTWLTSPLACGGFDGESLGAGPPATSDPVLYPNVVYYCTGGSLGTGGPVTSPTCSKSIDGGITFTPTGGFPYQPRGAQGVFPGWPGNPVVGDDGTLYLPKRHDGQPFVSFSRDEGATWTRVQVAANGSAGAATRMTELTDGRLAYTWIGSDHRPYLSVSGDGAATWSPPVMIAPPGINEAALARVAAGPAGSIAVAYLGTSNAPGGPPYYVYCNVLLSECEDGRYAGVEWSGYLASIADPFDPDPTIRTAAATPPGSPLFTGGCSADGACKAVLDFIDVAFAPDGSPAAAFVDDCALTRDFPPIVSASMTRCGDGLGEGIVLRVATG